MRTQKGFRAETLETFEWIFVGLFSVGLTMHGCIWKAALTSSGEAFFGPAFSNISTVVMPGLLIVPAYLLYNAGLAMDRYGSGETPVLCRRWSLLIGLILLVLLVAANAAFFAYAAT